MWKSIRINVRFCGTQFTRRFGGNAGHGHDHGHGHGHGHGHEHKSFTGYVPSGPATKPGFRHPMHTRPRFGPTGLFGLPIVWSCAVGVIVPPAIFLLFGTEKVEQKHWAEKSSPYFDYRGEKVGYHDYLKSHGKKHLLPGPDAHGHGHGHGATGHHEHAKEEEEAHPEEKAHEEHVDAPQETPKNVDTTEIKTSSFPEEVAAKVPEGKSPKVELKDHNPVKEEESRGYPSEPKTPIPEKKEKNTEKEKEKEKEKPKKGHH